MTNGLERRVARLEAMTGTDETIDIAKMLAAARVRARDDPEGFERERRAWVADCETRLAAGETLSAQAVELLDGHRRLERFEQMEAQS